MSDRYYPVSETMAASSERAAKWLRENRDDLPLNDLQYQRLLVDLEVGGAFVCRSALYKCAHLRDHGRLNEPYMGDTTGAFRSNIYGNDT